MGWLADRRQAARERDAEQRLRDLIGRMWEEDRQVAIHHGLVGVLGARRVDAILAEYGLPPVEEDRRAA
jgi:hypothetical protein